MAALAAHAGWKLYHRRAQHGFGQHCLDRGVCLPAGIHHGAEQSHGSGPIDHHVCVAGWPKLHGRLYALRSFDAECTGAAEHGECAVHYRDGFHGDEQLGRQRLLARRHDALQRVQQRGRNYASAHAASRHADDLRSEEPGDQAWHQSSGEHRRQDGDHVAMAPTLGRFRFRA